MRDGHRAAGAVTAMSRADGRYLLSGLVPGRYALSIRSCPGQGPRTSLVGGAIWPGLPAQVLVRAGQAQTMPPATLLPASQFASYPAGPPPAAQVSKTGRAGTGGISGTVTGGGRPLTGICASADRVGGGSGRYAATSKTGRYHIAGLAPGRYQVQFSTGVFCGNSGNWLSQWYRGITTPFPSSKAVKIQVRTGKITTGIDAAMRLGAEIRGTIRTRSGTPLPRICVTAFGRVPGGFVGMLLRSGPGGHYALHGLFPGRYTIEFSVGCGNKGNYAPQWWRRQTSAGRATPIAIKGTRIVSHVDAALDPGALITGTIRVGSAAGKPLAGICVQATDSRGDDFADAVSAKNGTYRLADLARGRYLIRFDPSCGGQGSSNYLAQQRRVTIRTAQHLAGINAYLQPAAGISGMVTGPHGHPADGVCVQVIGRSGGFAETGFDGSYSITGLPAGSYLVQFFGGCGSAGSIAPQFYDGEPSLGSADQVALTAGSITPNIDAAMQQGATITGVVTDAGGRRLDDICVGVADQSLLGFGDVFDDIEFTRHGSYRAVNLAPGLYQVYFGCGTSRYAGHFFRSKPGADAFGVDPLSLPAGVTGGIDAIMRLGGAITGVVTDTSGHRLDFACVNLADARTGRAVQVSFEQSLTQNGRYAITGLGAGTYKVQFTDCSNAGYASQWYRGKATEHAATPVRVRVGRTTSGIGAALATGGSISGRVISQVTGKPVGHVCVFTDDAATQSFGFAQTDKTGHYTVRGLATGRYSVFFSPCSLNGANLVASTRLGLVQVTAPHPVTGIGASLAPGGSISGTVLGGSPGPHPQIDVCAEVVPVDPNGSFGFAFTGSDGSYMASGLAAGQYKVYFNDPTCGFGVPQFASQWYDGQPTRATAATVSVSVGGTTSGIDATLQPFGGITGTVTSGAAHAPVAGECVLAVPAGHGFAGTQPPEEAVTAKDGGYSLTEVQPGRYKVKFAVGCGDSGFRTQWWDAAASAAAATVITVGAGATGQGIDASLRH